MRITEKHIEQMREALPHLVCIAEDKLSGDWDCDIEEGNALLAAIEGFEELLRRLERRTCK